MLKRKKIKGRDVKDAMLNSRGGLMKIKEQGRNVTVSPGAGQRGRGRERSEREASESYGVS